MAVRKKEKGGTSLRAEAPEGRQEQWQADLLLVYCCAP